MNPINNIRFLFFGSSSFSVHVLDALEEAGYSPLAVVTFPDKPQGRKMILQPNPVKTWAKERNIRIIEIKTFKDGANRNELEEIKAEVFVVASFGKILPSWLIYMPPHKTLNVHPSLLPLLRGPAPIQEAILQEQTTGVTIMRLDEKMDEGPLLAQETFSETLPMRYEELEAKLGKIGGNLLAKVLPDWISGEIKEIPQEHALATYTKKIEKSDSDITADSPDMALKKIYAYEVWPRARMGELIITSAYIEDSKLIIDKVVPPGKNEMPYEDYLRGNK